MSTKTTKRKLPGKTKAAPAKRKAAEAAKKPARKAPPVKKAAMRQVKKKPTNLLRGISDTNVNLLGADEWIKGFKFITYIDCFDGLHLNLSAVSEAQPR